MIIRFAAVEGDPPLAPDMVDTSFLPPDLFPPGLR
jgi:hypothetical protein